MAKYKKGDAVTCNVVAVQENGIEVKIADSELTAFIKRSDLSRDRSEQRPERFNVGDKVDAAVTTVDKAARRIAVRSRRWRSPKRSRPWRSTARPTRALRSATSSRPPSRSATRTREEDERKHKSNRYSGLHDKSRGKHVSARLTLATGG